jgi:hypothetical protein
MPYTLQKIIFTFFQMISAEAPVLFSKACEIFISELSLRAWIHTEDNKRRTLQVCYTLTFVNNYMECIHAKSDKKRTLT